jgi:hypothetical protein
MKPDNECILKRCAIVVGNATTSNLGKLEGPRQDADAMDFALEQANFEVIRAIDYTAAELDDAFGEFNQLLLKHKDNCLGLVYYSGHGIYHECKHYLAGIDFRNIKWHPMIHSLNRYINFVKDYIRARLSGFLSAVFISCQVGLLCRRQDTKHLE